MNTAKKALYLKIAGGIALISTLAYAAMTFAPLTQPVTTMAPYAFDAGNLLSGSTRAFRPWFENGAWQGDLIEYNVNELGIRSTDVAVGSNPPSAPGNNWMARATFADKEATVTDYWHESTTSGDGRRKIFTVNGDTGDQVDFLWDNLSDSQKLALDKDTVDAGLTGSYESNILNFVRGDRSEEKSGAGGTLRLRFSLLGDIINSNPVYIGAPEEAYVIEGYPTFKFANTSRAGRIAVGANDGMLHVFDASDGSEVYAYIPSMVIGNLGELATIPYEHTYYVDGELHYGSAFIDSTWKSVLSGGLGAGGRGLFVLDVTSPLASDNKVMYEITGDDVGYIYGKTRLGRNADGTWNVYAGNGYDSDNGVAKLLIISLENGSVTTISTGIAGGLSAPALVSGADRVVDYVFAGDSNGDMWKFNIADGSATKIFDGIADRPIMTAPVVGAHPNGGFMVFFGTGNKTSLVDVADTSYPTQAIYGIWDNPIDNNIVQQYLAETTATFTTDNGDGTSTSNSEDVRYIVDSAGDAGNATVDYAGSACQSDDSCAMGWMVELPNTGERVLGTPSLRAGRVSIVTTNPIGVDGEIDLEGDSWLMSLYWLTGGDGDDVSFNLSGDGKLNADDRFTVDGLSVPPTGVSLGDGMISQPAIVRVANGIDMVFINGLRLPLPQILRANTFLSGHIDVETDSPNESPLNGGLIAANTLSKHSEGYNVQTSDGLGRGVDGHVHAYDTIHNTVFVDFFELEPRRGLGNLSAIPVPASGEGSCPDGSSPAYTTPEEGGEPVFRGCVETIEPELNRAYDTYGSPMTEEVVSPPMAAEVYGLNSSTPLASDQPFIVVLANADLTPAGRIQIGCRIWDAEDYQDMITRQLEISPESPSVVAPADLVDENNVPLLVTLDSIANGRLHNGDSDLSTSGGKCSGILATDIEAGLSPVPTLRIAFTTRDILDGGIHGTRSQCVLGLHDYREKVCYSDAEILGAAEDAVAALKGGTDPVTYDNCDLAGPTPEDGSLRTPPDDYLRDPAYNLHITESLEGDNGKWRWRNGALTLQLLRVNKETNAAEYVLQDQDFLPQQSKGRTVTRFGGTYAQAFTRVSKAGGLNYPDAGGPGDLDPATENLIENGLLYESTLYWHYSDLADNLRRAAPASIPCYGDSNYNSALTQELGGVTLGEYQALIADLGDENEEGSLISDFSKLITALLKAIESGDESQVNNILLELGELLADNADTLGDYAKYRDYAPGHVPEQHLLDIDKNQLDPGGGYDGGDSADDGTPVDVDDLEGFGMGGGGGGGGGSGGGLAGNDVLEGLRIWIDPRD